MARTNPEETLRPTIRKEAASWSRGLADQENPPCDAVRSTVATNAPIQGTLYDIDRNQQTRRELVGGDTRTRTHGREVEWVAAWTRRLHRGFQEKRRGYCCERVPRTGPNRTRTLSGLMEDKQCALGARGGKETAVPGPWTHRLSPRTLRNRGQSPRTAGH